MKQIAFVICAFVICGIAAPPLSAEAVYVSCSLDKDLDEMAYTGLVWIDREGGFPYSNVKVNYWTQIFGTDADGPFGHQVWLTGFDYEILDQFVYQVDPNGCDLPWIDAQAFDLEESASGDEVAGSVIGLFI